MDRCICLISRSAIVPDFHLRFVSRPPPAIFLFVVQHALCTFSGPDALLLVQHALGTFLLFVFQRRPLRLVCLTRPMVCCDEGTATMRSNCGLVFWK